MDQSTKILDIGSSGTPFDQLFLYKDSLILDTRLRTQLIDNYTPAVDEKLIVEPTIATPIVVRRGS